MTTREPVPMPDLAPNFEDLKGEVTYWRSRALLAEEQAVKNGDRLMRTIEKMWDHAGSCPSTYCGVDSCPVKRVPAVEQAG